MADVDPLEAREWIGAIESVIDVDDPEKAHSLLDEVLDAGCKGGGPLCHSAATPDLNTIPLERQEGHLGDWAIEQRARSMIRCSALAAGLRTDKTSSELGEHIASFQSSALLYDTDFMHFWCAPSADRGFGNMGARSPWLARRLKLDRVPIGESAT